MTPLEAARSQLGVREVGGPNRGIPFDRYALIGEDPLPWCGRFVRWCFINGGTPLPGQKYSLASVQKMREELQKRGALLPGEAAPEPGDLIFLRNRGASDTGPGTHVGIVESVTQKTVCSIDGNWGDAVARVVRARASPEIACYARWPMRPMA